TSEPEEDIDPDNILQDVNELLDDLIPESVKLVGKPDPLMTKDDKIKCIQFLHNKGAFLVTKSGDKVSYFYNISRSSV
ncbi:helix-turn-helix domain-containing protein, partial [Enterococcus faecalis]|uniref:helix-turn-helix domain-containing protein n=1 Tax=Enterococcus faecalis TaxID=1351 RepID=UPI003D6A4B2A